VTSMTAPLRRVAVRGLPTHADYADAGWERLPDLRLAGEQHAALVAALEEAGAEVDVLLPAEGLADACYTYDPVFVTGAGMVVLRQAKPCRSAEPPLLASELAGLGVPEVGRLTGDARADGGDLFWLDDHTLAAGRSHRTNAVAHAQLAALLEPEGVRVLPFHLPWHRGPAEVLHLMSVISPVAPDLAVVYEPIAPTPLLDELAARGIAWIPVSDEEYAALGSNILATGPGRVIIFAGAPDVERALRDAGVDVTVLDGSEFAAGTGGPTCVTRPLLRS
jgi:N-dimethylarginine dimethylaminohydrolase